jgi:hypothetical protein
MAIQCINSLTKTKSNGKQLFLNFFLELVEKNNNKINLIHFMSINHPPSPQRSIYLLTLSKLAEFSRIYWGCTVEFMFKISAQYYEVWGRYSPKKCEARNPKFSVRSQYCIFMFFRVWTSVSRCRAQQSSSV